MRLSRRARRADRVELDCRAVGHALLIHSRGKLDAHARSFAGGLAADRENTVVVVDLPATPPDGTWESIAGILVPHGRSFRLIFGRADGARSIAAAQELANRLGRTVFAPDGKVLPAGGGALFVPPGRGWGWLRFDPGRPAVPHSRRFAAPRWDAVGPSPPWPTSVAGVAEPIPGGVWLRPAAGQDPRAQRSLLVANMNCRTDVLKVVLGRPGAPELSLDDIARFWDILSPGTRSLARFIQFGPVAVPAGASLGQALANRLTHPVNVYTGLPMAGVSGESRGEVIALAADGSLGHRPFVRELVYRPSQHTDGVTSPPVLLGHRQPVAGLPHVGADSYQYAPDVVLEVIQSGLWLRPPAEPADAFAVRVTPADANTVTIYFDASTPWTAARMHSLAEDLRGKLDPAISRVCPILPAGERPTGQEKPGDLGAELAVALDTGETSGTAEATVAIEYAATATDRMAAPSRN